MLANVDGVEDVQARMLLLRFQEAAEKSPYLNETQKLIIERHLQEIVNVWTCEDYI